MTGTVQSPPVSRAFTSRLREVLTARLPQDPRWVVWVDGVVEELAAGCGVEDPRLAQIRALCDERDPSGKGSPFERSIWPHEVRRILDAPPVDATASRPVSRASAVEALTQIRALFSDETWWHISEHSLRRKVRAVLDAVSVDATPAHGIDRGALERVLQAFIETRPPMSIRECADRVLALVRPVEGIVLSPEEARRAVGWLDMSNVVPEGDDLALANRLEVS